MGCIAECSPVLTALTLGDNCEPAFMQGGLYKISFMKCDKDFDDVTGGVITDLDRWTDMIEATDIVVSSPILGSKPEDSVTRLRVNSCQPEVVTGGTKTFNFEDFNADLETSAQITWWKQIQQKYNQLKVIFITCDEFVYGPYDNGTWAINVSEIRETVKETPTKWAGSITVSDNGLLTVPVKVVGITSIL